MRRFVAGLALSTALLGGCGAAQEELPSPPTPLTSEAQPSTSPVLTYEEQVDSIQGYAQEATSFWAAEGVDISSTRLEIIEGAEEVSCGETIRAADYTSGYCRYIGAIIVTETFIRYMNSDAFQPRVAPELPREMVFVFHEAAHVAQYARNPAMTSDDYLANRLRYELGADCDAGRTVQSTNPEATDIVQKPNFVYFPGDENQPENIHGTSQQRKASFLAGFNGENCHP